MGREHDRVGPSVAVDEPPFVTSGCGDSPPVVSGPVHATQ
jgi:hypothetical protein